MANRQKYFRQYYQDNKIKRIEYYKQYRKTITGYLQVCFQAMNRRCNNPKTHNYKHYGGRGIEMRFTSLNNFREYVVNELQIDPRGLTVDRIDNNGHYESGNIRFITRIENNRKRFN